jgi:hypothetical protein
MIVSHLRHRSVVVIGAAAVLALAVGCSSSSSGGTVAPASSAPGSSAPAPSAAASSAPASSTPITIGVAVPDLSAFVKFSKAFGVGNPQAQAASVLAAWKTAGSIPVNGHPIKFVYKSYSITDDAAKTAVCKTFAQDDHVFAVIGGQSFETGAQCLTGQFHIPVVDLDSAPSSSYQQGSPDYFTLNPDQNVLFKDYIDWAAKAGYFKGQTLGIYEDSSAKESVDIAKAELTKLGYKVASDVTANSAGVGSSSDQLAMQKFKAAGVTMMLPMMSGSSEINALGYAAKQHYNLKVVDFDYGNHVTDVAAGAFPAALYNNTPALTFTQVGEKAAGTAPTAAQTSCINNYNTFSGANLAAASPDPSGEFQNLLWTCDMANVVLKGLQNAGNDVTAASFIAGLEKIQNMPSAGGGNVSFSATDHWGVHQLRPVKWTAACHCWTGTGDFFSTS